MDRKNRHRIPSELDTHYVSKRNCKFHYDVSPMKIARASGCHIFDEDGESYLDCVSSMAPLGHCRPEVVRVMTTQMGTCATHFANDALEENPLHPGKNITATPPAPPPATSRFLSPPELARHFSSKLLSTLPSNCEHLNQAIILRTSSEANDLAFRIARARYHDAVEKCSEGGDKSNTDSGGSHAEDKRTIKVNVRDKRLKSNANQVSKHSPSQSKRVKYSSSTKTRRTEIVSVEGAFHGNLTSCLALSSDPRHHGHMRDLLSRQFEHVIPCPALDSNESSSTENESLKASTKSSKPVVEGRQSTEPVVEGRESSKPVVEGCESTEPVVEGCESTEPVVEGRQSTEPVDEGSLSLDALRKSISTIEKSGKKLAAFICEPFMSKSGMIQPPQNHLKTAYSMVRAAGGLCIAEEVQTSFGRLGDCFWSFENHGVVPDIITVGKPLGNGYPLAALITTEKLASLIDRSDEQLDPVACAVGATVLRVHLQEKLQQRCAEVGDHTLRRLRELQSRHEIIAQIRGKGLAIGILIRARKENPQRRAKGLAQDMMYGLKRKRVLVQVIGPNEDVISITPPLTFSVEDAERLVEALEEVANEINDEKSQSSDLKTDDKATLDSRINALDAGINYESMD